MAGRPSKLTKQVEADLTLLLAEGVPVKLAASATGVSPRSVRRWLRDRDLRERVAEIRAAGRGTLHNPVMQSEPPDHDVALTEATSEAWLVVLLLRSPDWKASAWWLERRYPSHWGAERMHA